MTRLRRDISNGSEPADISNLRSPGNVTAFGLATVIYQRLVKASVLGHLDSPVVRQIIKQGRTAGVEVGNIHPRLALAGRVGNLEVETRGILQVVRMRVVHGKRRKCNV